VFSSITIVLVAITVLVSISAFNDQRLFSNLLFEPFVIKSRGQWYRFLSHALIHANWPHLLVNMFVLYMFGSGVEAAYGMITGGSSLLPFLGLYVGGIIFSTLPSYKKHIHDPSYRAVGASGAVSAVLFAQILMEPMGRMGLLILPGVRVPAFVFGLLYLAYSWYMDRRSSDNVAHDAHFFGALYGIAFTGFLEPRFIFEFGHYSAGMDL
jgi:membrane associated rhomboid family serine protease